jgi:hypothetical protein
MHVNEWMNDECPNEGTYTQNINSSSMRVHILRSSIAQKKTITLEIATKIASVNDR